MDSSSLPNEDRLAYHSRIPCWKVEEELETVKHGECAPDILGLDFPLNDRLEHRIGSIRRAYSSVEACLSSVETVQTRLSLVE